MRTSTEKLERQRLLIDIVKTKTVTRQDQLVGLLRTNGFAVTQASVSRDLDELRISKTMGVYRQVPSRERSTFGLLSFTPSGDSLIVARCGSGLASALAVQLDSSWIEGIVGTIAGDDTVFIAVADHDVQQSVLPKLRKTFEV